MFLNVVRTEIVALLAVALWVLAMAAAEDILSFAAAIAAVCVLVTLITDDGT